MFGMTWARDLIDGDWAGRLRRRGLPTGLQDLDALTDGITCPSLWLLIGTPGAGRTTLACQFALSAALSGPSTVTIISGHDQPNTLLANMLCAQGKVPAHHLYSDGLDAHERTRLQEAVGQMSTTSLRVLSTGDREWQHDESTSVPDLNLLIGGPRPPAQLLVVDDADLLLNQPVEQALPALRAWCHQAGFALLLTAPEEPLLTGGRAHPAVRRQTDVLLRLTREDQFDSCSPRAGEADLHLVSHRNGPTAQAQLAFQGHYRRFVDLP
jgi:replicative DNA helicase